MVKLYDWYRLYFDKESLIIQKNKFKNITFFIKTFERPKALKNLLKSIDKYYGILGHDLKIIIVDDSEKPKQPVLKLRNNIEYYTLPFDSGLSRGRNFMLDKTSTKYFLLLDDDFVFTKKTKIEKLYDIIEEKHAIDILSGSVYNKGKKKINSNCVINFENGVLTRYNKTKREENGIKYYDFVINFFLAKTNKIKKIRWDDELKIVEHTAFFLKCRSQELVVASCDDVRVNHIRPKVKRYSRFRTDRVAEYQQLLFKKYGINKITEV